jgi:hypothetical protein
MDVDPLDPAAALAGIEHRPVDQRIHRRVEVGILHDVAGVLAPQLGADADEGAGGGALHLPTACDGAGEVHEVDMTPGDQRGGGLVVDEEVGEDVLRHAGLVEGVGHPLADQQGLRRMLEQHRVAGDQRRRDRVDRRHVGIVPRRHDQHDADGQPADVAGEGGVLADMNVGQRLFSDRRHVGGAFLDAAELAAIAHGPAHHVRQLRDDLVVHRAQGGDAGANELDPLLQRAGGPFLLGGLQAGGEGLRLVMGQAGTLREDRSVDRRDAGQGLGHVGVFRQARSKLRAIS